MSDRIDFPASGDNASMPSATVIPVLHYPDVAAASAWLQRAFGFTERLRIGGHRVQLSVGAAAVVLAEGSPPDAEAGPSFSIMVRVADADAHATRAASASAEIAAAPQSFPYGERQYTAIDLAGYAWTFSQSVANVHPSSWGGTLVEE